MRTSSEEPTIHEQVTMEAKLEQENSSLHGELMRGHVERAPAAEGEEQARPQTRTRLRRSSRRKMLTKGLGRAAATLGAGVLLKLSGGTALASSIKPGVFANNTADAPAVSATGTNGANGMDASSDRGTAVSAISTSGNGIFAQSSSADAIHVVGGGSGKSGLFAEGGSGFGVYATSIRSYGVFGQSRSGTGVVASGNIGVFSSGHVYGVTGQSTNSNGVGVRGFSSSGIGVFGKSSSGTGVFGSSGTGLAGLFDGNVQVNGNFSASGTKNFVQTHPTDPSQEIVYVALEGGEAGTYVRGTGQLQSGKAVLAVPEHFWLVTATEGLTVQLTPRGEWLQLYVVELNTAQFVVREAQGKNGAFDYLIHGVRRGYEQHEVIRTKS